MRYFVIVLLVAAAVAFFVFKGGSMRWTPQVISAVDPPQKQFEKLFESDTVDAAKLAALCSSYPRVAAAFLKNRTFKLAGTVQDFRVAGVDGKQAEVLLHTGNSRVMAIALDRSQPPTINQPEVKADRYEVGNDRLLWGGSTIYTKNQSVTLSVVASSIGSSTVSFALATGARRP